MMSSELQAHADKFQAYTDAWAVALEDLQNQCRVQTPEDQTQRRQEDQAHDGH